MTYDEYIKIGTQASELAEKQDFDGAITILMPLVESDLAAADRAVMCMNIAILEDKKGNLDGAIQWYEKAAVIEEKNHLRYVLEVQASFYSQIGRKVEALNIYKKLMAHPTVNENDKLRLQQQLKALQS